MLETYWLDELPLDDGGYELGQMSWRVPGGKGAEVTFITEASYYAFPISILEKLDDRRALLDRTTKRLVLEAGAYIFEAVARIEPYDEIIFKLIHKLGDG